MLFYSDVSYPVGPGTQFSPDCLAGAGCSARARAGKGKNDYAEQRDDRTDNQHPANGQDCEQGCADGGTDDAHQTDGRRVDGDKARLLVPRAGSEQGVKESQVESCADQSQTK